MGSLDFDTSGLNEGFERMERAVAAMHVKATDAIALKLLQLSQEEVPIYIGDDHLGGHLQNSGTTDRDGEDAIVGYNTPYAAYQHEGQFKDGTHVIHNHTSDRGKTKYLEDPLKNNLEVFLSYYGQKMKEIFG